MKKIFTTLLLLLVAITASAQSGAIKGQLFDAETKEAVLGAVITVAPTA